jgi:hypothetical protein
MSLTAETVGHTYQHEGLLVCHAQPAPRKPGAARRRPPLLLVHGAGHGAWCWENWLRTLPRHGWEGYALSLRNHPGSRTVEREDYLSRLRVDDYVDDVATVARHIGRPVVLVGHSMGGLIAQRYAARPPAKAGIARSLFREAPRPVAALVLLASAGPGALGPLRGEALPLDSGYLPDADTARARYFYRAPQAVVDAAVPRLVEESPSVMNDYSLAPGLAVDPTAIGCPVLSVTAEYDGTSVPRDGRLAAYYGGEHMPCRDIGHDLMLDEGWEPVLDQILAWVRRAVLA